MKKLAVNTKRLLNALCELLLTITMTFVAGAALVGCDVHEFPVIVEEPIPDPVIPTSRKMLLHLQFDTLMPLYRNVTVSQTKSSAGRAAMAEDGYDVRYIVNVYPNVDGGISRKLDTSFVFTRDRVDSLDYTAHIELEGGDYTLLVWSDYIERGTNTDYFYNTGDFTKINIAGDEYVGRNDYRGAYRGCRQSFVQAPVSPSDTLAQIVDIQMVRPMAKYRFISTDYRQFIAESKVHDISGYKIMFKYSGYMPHQFNMFTNRPSDSKTGVTYGSSIEALGEEEALLGFDYVFVNGNESSVQVALHVEDNEGNKVADIGTIDIPLVRGKITEVRGAFLTSRAGGGIGIDAGFDGEYNIFIK